MSKMKNDRKRLLAKSPMRVRPRRSSTTPLQTPLGSLNKLQKPICKWDSEEMHLHPKCCSISCELWALAKMVHNEFGDNNGDSSLSANSSPLFERGRFYEEYSVRRNERLKRKKGETGDLGVTVESSNRQDSKKKLERLRKSVAAAYSVERSRNPRYLLRGMTKENKMPPLAVNCERKIGDRIVRKI